MEQATAPGFIDVVPPVQSNTLLFVIVAVVAVIAILALIVAMMSFKRSNRVQAFNGSAYQPPYTPAQPDKMFCSRCGSQNSHDAAFCVKCGAGLKQ